MSGRRPARRCRGEIEQEIDALGGGDGGIANPQSKRCLREEGEFLAQAVHELRSPLAILQGVHFLLERDHAATAKATGQVPDARSRRHLALLGEAIQSLSNQVDRLLDLQAVATDGRPAAPASLVEVLTAAAERASLVRGKQERVRCTIDRAIPEDTHVDGGRLTLALRNLISNALKYSTPSGLVDVTAQPAGHDRLRIEVRDRGRGVPLADRDRLGEPYFRASNSSETAGTGLGLSVVRRAIMTMGGSFGYQSPPAGEPGAIFWLEFPAIRECIPHSSPISLPQAGRIARKTETTPATEPKTSPRRQRRSR